MSAPGLPAQTSWHQDSQWVGLGRRLERLAQAKVWGLGKLGLLIWPRGGGEGWRRSRGRWRCRAARGGRAMGPKHAFHRPSLCGNRSEDTGAQHGRMGTGRSGERCDHEDGATGDRGDSELVKRQEEARRAGCSGVPAQTRLQGVRACSGGWGTRAWGKGQAPRNSSMAGNGVVPGDPDAGADTAKFFPVKHSLRPGAWPCAEEAPLRSASAVVRKRHTQTPHSPRRQGSNARVRSSLLRGPPLPRLPGGQPAFQHTWWTSPH